MQSETADISIDDAVLVHQCRQGDSDAMQRLIFRYQSRIYNIILRMCANTDDAAELTQETFVKIIENIKQFQGRSSFYTWAFRIAVNLTLNHCQKNLKLKFRPLDTQENQSDEPAKLQLKQYLSDDRSPDPADLAQNRELCEIAIKSLMKLDDDHRAVLILRDIEGMSYAQMAEVLNVPLGTVRSRISRARCNIRDILEAASQ